MKLSNKQEDFLYKPLNDINILSGVTNSGKSFVANMRFYEEICKMPSRSKALLTGNTLDTLYKNVISELLEIDETEKWLTFTRQPAMIRVSNGVEVFCYGANNEGTDKKIKGGNVQLWMGDEITTSPKSITDMCLSRCRMVVNDQMRQMPAIWTTNPDDPASYIKLDFIDKKDILDIAYYQYGFYDNPTMTEEWIIKAKKLYSGIFFDRMILGKWVGDTEKMVLPEFTEEKSQEIVKSIPDPDYFDVNGALDPAFEDNTGYLIGYYDFLNARCIISNELLLSKKNTKVLAEEIRRIEKETFGEKKIYNRVSDTASQVICDLIELHDIMISSTKKDDLHAQINYLRVMIQNNKIVIHPRCVNLIWQMKTCLWDNNRKQFMRNEKDRHYDLVAALIYFVRNVDIYRNPYPPLPEHITEDKFYIGHVAKKVHALGSIFE